MQSTYKIDGLPNQWQCLWQRHRDQHKAAVKLQQLIGYRFSRFELLSEALTHRSALSSYNLWAKKTGTPSLRLPWNEKLEFLGDSVLNFVVSSTLWNLRERSNEGHLSKLRSMIVNEASLVHVAQGMDLASCILMGRGEERATGRHRKGLLADTLEALIGAIYLDGGVDAARQVILSLFSELLAKDLSQLNQDFKSRLQEKTQRKVKKPPEYKMVSEVGPDHQKEFSVAVILDEKTLAVGVGPSKKLASQDAARKALKTPAFEAFMKDEDS